MAWATPFGGLDHRCCCNALFVFFDGTLACGDGRAIAAEVFFDEYFMHPLGQTTGGEFVKGA